MAHEITKRPFGVSFETLSQFGILLLLFVIALVHVLTLMSVPAPFCDEMWLAARSWNFVTIGKSFSTLDSGVFDRYDGYWTFFPLLPSILGSVAYVTASVPSLPPIRIISIISGLILLFAVYRITKSLSDKTTALLAVLILASNHSFFFASHLGRPDIYAITSAYLGVMFYFCAKKDNILTGIISGLLVVIGAEAHPNAAVIGAALGLQHLFDHGRRVLKSQQFWGYVLGGVIGCSLYFALHIARYPDTYLQINKIAFSATHTPPILTGDMSVISDALIDVPNVLSYFFGKETFVLILALFSILLIGKRNDKRIFFHLLAVSVLYALLVRNSTLAYYAIILNPAVCIVCASTFGLLIKYSWSHHFIGRAVLIASSLFAVSELPTVAKMIPATPYADLLTAEADLKRVIDPSDRIIGAQTYWFGFHDHYYMSWEALIYYRRLFPGSTVKDAVDALRPTIILVDDHLRRYLKDDTDLRYTGLLSLPSHEFHSFLKEHTHLIGSVRSMYGDTVEVYRIDS